ncbi:hypothetical protein GCM10009687_56330 [Asanoa iriomotensis]|uniref:Uncharacterized protein n=1 Tax=Asanoa iriomotensis TaxID=234613 RepID=A0ABQ4CFV2_9ACTN|nr:hypothetical protein Air01nite_77470 [Asanoa iriomotensis]
MRTATAQPIPGLRMVAENVLDVAVCHDSASSADPHQRHDVPGSQRRDDMLRAKTVRCHPFARAERTLLTAMQPCVPGREEPSSHHCKSSDEGYRHGSGQL